MAIKYLTERVTIETAQLTSWRAWIDGQFLKLAGRCPVCAHESKAAVPRQVIALEAVAGTHALTVSVNCACEQVHADRPDGVVGCGRRWSCTATTDAQSQVKLSPLADPTLVASAPPGLPNGGNGELLNGGPVSWSSGLPEKTPAAVLLAVTTSHIGEPSRS